MTTAFELGPDDQQPDGSVVLPWPGAVVGHPGDVVTIVDGPRIRRARIRRAGRRVTIADPIPDDAA